MKLLWIWLALGLVQAHGVVTSTRISDSDSSILGLVGYDGLSLIQQKVIVTSTRRTSAWGSQTMLDPLSERGPSSNTTTVGDSRTLAEGQSMVVPALHKQLPTGPSHPWSWVRAGIAILFGVGFLAYIFQALFFDPKVPSHTRRDLAVSVQSAWIYLLMSAPVVSYRLQENIPTYLGKVYCYMPFWYIFGVASFSGNFIALAISSVSGMLLSVLSMSFLNCLLPGGAGPLGKSEEFVRRAWVPGGYDPTFAAIFAGAFACMLFASKIDVNTKRYALGMFGQFIVAFMNPHQDEAEFAAVVYDWDFNINWRGPVLCQCYVILASVILAGLSIPVVWFMPSSRSFFSSHGELKRELSDISKDTIGFLEKILHSFREDLAASTLHSSLLYKKHLSDRLSDTEMLAYYAGYECCSQEARANLAFLRLLATSLSEMHQVLQILLDLLKERTKTIDKADDIDITLNLEDFALAFQETMTSLVEAANGRSGCMEDLRGVSKRMDSPLLASLQYLEECAGVDRNADVVFVETLRTFPTIITEAGEGLKKIQEEPLPGSGWCWSLNPQFLVDSFPHFTGDEQPFNTARKLLSWMLALLWCLRVRDYDGTCIVGMSFVFSSTLGSLFDRNINRMVGVGMGLVVSNLPATLLTNDVEINYTDFINWPQDLIVYMLIMFLMWTASIYGYLAKGAKWSYACSLWAGFGGVQMLTNLQRLQHFSSRLSTGEKGSPLSFEVKNMMMDNFVACFICLLVDLCFARICRGLTTERVGATVPLCIEDIADCVEEFRERPTAANTEILRKRIALARWWDAEVAKDDLVWSALWVPPYDGNLVQAVLECCETAHHAATALKAAAKRVSDRDTAKSALEEVWPPDITVQIRRHSETVEKALLGELDLPDRGKGADAHLDTMEKLGRLEVHSLQASEAPSGTDMQGCLDRAATLALTSHAGSLYLAILRSEELIRDFAFWACEEWSGAEKLRDLRALSGAWSIGRRRELTQAFSEDFASRPQEEGEEGS